MAGDSRKEEETAERARSSSSLKRQNSRSRSAATGWILKGANEKQKYERSVEEESLNNCLRPNGELMSGDDRDIQLDSMQTTRKKPGEERRMFGGL